MNWYKMELMVGVFVLMIIVVLLLLVLKVVN